MEIKEIRSLFLKFMGNAIYNSWFKPLKIEIRDNGILALIAPHNFAAEYLDLHYAHRLKAILEELPENITNLSIFAPEDLKEKTRIERTSQPQNYEILDQGLEVDPVMDKEFCERDTFEEIRVCEESTGNDLSEGVTSQTQALRQKLHQILPSNRIPTWLSEVEVETVSPRGEAIVVFEDNIMVDWCKNQFSGELFFLIA